MTMTRSSRSKTLLGDEPVEPVAVMCRRWGYRYATVAALIADDTLQAEQHPSGGYYFTNAQSRAALAHLQTNGLPTID